MRTNKGFSLLEILVAFAILSLSLGTLLGVFGRGLKTASLSEHYAQAAIIAESKLTEIGTLLPLEESESSGVEKTYHWQVLIEPYQWPPEDVDPAFPIEALTPFHIKINVSWLQGSKPQFVAIESLQLKGK